MPIILMVVLLNIVINLKSSKIFDIGVSWGAFTFMFSSILSIVCGWCFKLIMISDL